MIMAKGTDVAAVSLANAPVHGVYRIDRVCGPDQRRLCELGLVEGQQLSIINRPGRQMMVVKVGGSRLALTGGMADCVWVK